MYSPGDAENAEVYIELDPRLPSDLINIAETAAN